MAGSLKMRIEFRFIWNWYEETKEGVLSTYTHSLKFNTLTDLDVFVEKVRANLPDTGMKLLYRIERITTEILEEKKK